MDILLTEDGDIDTTHGKFSLANGVTAIAQHMRIRVRFFLGEWFLDQREGVPYYRDVFIKNPSRAVVVSTFKRVILSTPGVATLDRFEFELDRSTRVATIDWEVTTTDGVVLTSADYGPFILGRLV